MSSLELRYQPLTPDLAPALVDCVHAVYGENYSLPDFYDVENIRALLQAGLLYAFVGLNARGEVVATLGAQLECAGAITVDGRTGMVRNAYRQHGALKELGLRMVEVYQRLQTHGIQMYAVTFHPISQKHGLSYGCFVTGLLPAHFPPAMVPVEYGAFAGRFGAVTMFYQMRPLPPAAVCLPAPYRELLAGIYARNTIERHEIAAGRALPGEETRFSISFNVRTRVTSVRILGIGDDFCAALARLEAEIVQGDSAVTYLDLPLASPASHQAVASANRQGFFFGALLPARQAGDMLRLQKFALDSVIPGEMKLCSAEVRQMLDYVLADARRVAGFHSSVSAYQFNI